ATVMTASARKTVSTWPCSWSPRGNRRIRSDPAFPSSCWWGHRRGITRWTGLMNSRWNGSASNFRESWNARMGEENSPGFGVPSGPQKIQRHDQSPDNPHRMEEKLKSPSNLVFRSHHFMDDTGGYLI